MSGEAGGGSGSELHEVAENLRRAGEELTDRLDRLGSRGLSSRDREELARLRSFLDDLTARIVDLLSSRRSPGRRRPTARPAPADAYGDADASDAIDTGSEDSIGGEGGEIPW